MYFEFYHGIILRAWLKLTVRPRCWKSRERNVTRQRKHWRTMVAMRPYH